MSETPRTDAAVFTANSTSFGQRLVNTDFARELERENTTLRNYLMTLASDGAKPGDAKTIWRKVRGGMI